MSQSLAQQLVAKASWPMRLAIRVMAVVTEPGAAALGNHGEGAVDQVAGIVAAARTGSG